MAQYSLYKLDFRKGDGQTSLKFEDSNLPTLDNAQEFLERMLTQGTDYQWTLPIVKTKNGESDRLINTVEHKINKITCLCVCNKKIIKYREGMADEQLEHHPGCRVIIDNRDGIGQVAIEHTSSFDDNPNKVAQLLKDAITRNVEQYGIVADIRPKWRTGEFWQVIDERRLRGDRITKVEYDFPVIENVLPIDASDEMINKIQWLHTLMATTQAAKSGWYLQEKQGRGLTLDRTQSDLVHLLDFCSNNSYIVTVHFNKSGTYTCGENVIASRDLPFDIVKEFVDGQSIHDADGNTTFRLITWLDESREMTSDYKDEEIPIIRRRKRENKQ